MRTLKVVKGNTIEEQIASIDSLLASLFSRGDCKRTETRVIRQEVKVLPKKTIEIEEA